MRKQKFTRLLCLALATLFLVSTAVVTVSAGNADGVTDKSIYDYVDKLKTDTYQQYMADEKNKEYFSDPDTDFDPIRFDTNTSLVFEAEGEKKLTVGDKVIPAGSWYMTISISGANVWTMNVTEVYLDDGETKTALVKSYSSLEAALADTEVKLGEGPNYDKFEKSELVFCAEFGKDGDKQLGLYTPGLGSVTWTLDMAASGADAGLYAIELEYFPIYTLEGYEDPIAKSSAVEREFYINGEAPFSEARALTISKIWSSYKADGISGLTATYKPGKGETVAGVIAEAADAGLKAAPSSDGNSVVVDQPLVITASKNAFITKYGLRFMIVDAERNELRPTMVQDPVWTSYTFRDSQGYSSDDFGFVLKPDENGKIEFTLEGVNESMALSAIVLKPYTRAKSYSDYLAEIESTVGLKEGTDTVKLEAELPTNSSTNVVYPIEDRTSPVTSPADTSRVMLNTIGTEKWATAGQWLEYTFEVDAAGMYEIYSRYKQSYLDGMYVSRSLQIYTNYESAAEYEKQFGNTAGYYNGVPFEEAARLSYKYGDKWQITNMTAGADANDDGKADTYQIYFEEGVTYTLHFEVTLGSMSEQVQKIEAILNSLNADYLSIIKLTGTSPDDYRDYGFTRLLPDTLRDFYYQAQSLGEVSAYLQETADVASTYSSTCDKLIDILLDMFTEPDDIAKNLSNFKSYIGNLGTFLTDAKTQPLQLDYLSIQPASASSPKAEGNFFQVFWHECQSFIQSFFRDYNSMGAMETEGEGESVNVWLAYGRDQSQVIRNMTTNEFTPETGIAVDLKLVSGGTLLPSILAGMGPDVYLGLADATVINYAIRGALTNIENKDGFTDIVERCFNRAAMLQLEIADSDGVVHTYGLPETQTFQMMFVRLDILGDLDIEIPKTWDDLFVAQSKLESHNMEIGVPTNYKVFLYQANGDLYADDGMRINLDSVKGLAAFEKMCSMFTQYSFPYKYDPANRFRTGEYPIIISSYTDLYNKLKVFATEIEGKWTFVPIPGTLQEDKETINNTADCTIAAVVMISNLNNEDAAWSFMKWYTGDEAQTKYANEMVAIIGDSAKHPTANREALKQMPWTRDEYKEVSKQFENLAAIPNYPGSYYLDRHTNFAFLAAYNDDKDPSASLLSYINTINNEITRKREEFKLETLEIGQTLAGKRMDQAMTAMDLLKEIDKDKYAAGIDKALYGVANENEIRLHEAARLFSAMLEYDYIVDLDKIDNDDSLSDERKTEKKKEIVENVKEYSFFINVGKQTAETKNGGYAIDSLSEEKLVYFVAECLRNAADAIIAYNR